MRLRPLVGSFVAVVSLVVGACAPDFPEPKAESPGCAMLARTAVPCTVDINVDSPEKLQSMRDDAVRRRPVVARALGAFCPDYVAVRTLQVQDACVATLDSILPQAIAEAAKRRAIAAPAVAALRADARYAPARDKFHAVRIQQSVACDTTDATACKLAKNDTEAAATVVRGLFAEHQIDLRDADALGLW